MRPSVADDDGGRTDELASGPRVNRLVALDLPAGDGWVDELRRAWDDGDAVFPLDPRLPGPARRAVLAAMAPAELVGRDGRVALDGSRPVEPGDAVVVATSGSTGEPKGVVLTHDAVAASARATSARIGATSADTWLACLPLAHIGGLSVITRAVTTGTRLIVHDGFHPDAVEAAVDQGATLVSLVPTALRRVDPARFRTVVLGGARPPEQLPANVLTTYGMTETGSGLVYDGVALDGVEVRVGDDGDISVRGPMLLRAYRSGNDPKDAAGWLLTGDVGEFDARGRLVVHGRRGDLIVTGAEKVWPEQVEPILRTVTGVQDGAVVGVEDSEWGHEVTAIVVPGVPAPDALALLAEIRDAVKATLPAYCAPRRVVFAQAIPRTALGKVRRNELLALVSPK